MTYKRNLTIVFTSLLTLPLGAADASKSNTISQIVDYPNTSEPIVDYTPPSSPETSNDATSPSSSEARPTLRRQNCILAGANIKTFHNPLFFPNAEELNQKISRNGSKLHQRRLKQKKKTVVEEYTVEDLITSADNVDLYCPSLAPTSSPQNYTEPLPVYYIAANGKAHRCKENIDSCTNPIHGFKKPYGF